MEAPSYVTPNAFISLHSNRSIAFHTNGKMSAALAEAIGKCAYAKQIPPNTPQTIIIIIVLAKR